MAISTMVVEIYVISLSHDLDVMTSPAPTNLSSQNLVVIGIIEMEISILISVLT